MNRYDVDLKSYEGRKAIAYYSIFYSNAVFNEICVVDVVYRYGTMLVIYYGDSSNENCPGNYKLHYAKVQEDMTLYVKDCFGKKHHISYNQFLRVQ